MALADDLSNVVGTILNQTWDIRDGQVVPETDDIALAGGAVRLSATILYADLADSTELAMGYDRRIAAKVFRAYLACCTRLVRANGGHVRSFDGDRVMGVFIGDRRNTSAAKCALNIAHTFSKVLKPQLESKYETLKNGPYNLRQTSGVDTGEILVIRGGIRNNSDLVWVGRAPNVAAKLSSIRTGDFQTYITKDVFMQLADSSKYGPKGDSMWEKCSWTGVAGIDTIYRSHWTWSP